MQDSIGLVDIKKIKLLARQQGIKFGYICERLGKHFTYLNDVEKGKASMPMEAVEIVADILGTSADSLLVANDALPDEHNAAVIGRIKEIANEKGIKIKYICSQIGLSETYLSNVKNGKDRMTDERLSAIAEVLGVPVCALSGTEPSVVDRIRILSKTRGRSLSYLCREMGVTSGYFIDIEKSGRNIPRDKLAVIASCLDTTPEYLLGETDDPYSPDVKIGVFLDEDEEILLSCYRKLSAEQKIGLRRFLETIV